MLTLQNLCIYELRLCIFELHGAIKCCYHYYY